MQAFGRESVDICTFEEAVVHEFGIVGHFLSMLGFEHDEIQRFNIIKSNESASGIAADIISYINEKFPMITDGKLHERRSNGDINPLLKIRGSKFDIPYGDKKMLFEIVQDDIKWLQENCAIDYSNIEVPQTNKFENIFSEESIIDIKKAYLNLSTTLKSLLIEYLQKQF